MFPETVAPSDFCLHSQVAGPKHVVASLFYLGGFPKRGAYTFPILGAPANQRFDRFHAGLRKEIQTLVTNIGSDCAFPEILKHPASPLPSKEKSSPTNSETVSCMFTAHVAEAAIWCFAD